MHLARGDLKLLDRILRLGHELERSGDEILASETLEVLKNLIENLSASAEDESLRRLSFHHLNLSAGMSLRHFSAILTPFERLLNRALRDDEIVIKEGDGSGERRVAPLIVVADNIRSAFNVGAIFRTSEAFGAEGVCLTGYTSTPLEDRTKKTSMGTEDHIPWTHEPKARETLLDLKAQGYSIIALETAERAVPLGSFRWPEKSALVLGNERYGLDPDLLKLADHVLRIPLYGVKNSLNVGIALGAALSDWRRQNEGQIEDQRFKSIGTFLTSKQNPYEARRQGSEDATGEIGAVHLHAGRGFEQALRDLEGFSRIWLLYEFDRNLHWHPMVMPPRGPRIKRGVFATRAPYRPVPIGMSAVELIRIEGLKLHVRGFDLLDQTPILDIKPYLPSADAFPGVRAGWTEGLNQSAYKVDFSPRAETQLRWLSDEGISQLEDFIRGQLEYDPLDEKRKRVTHSGQGFELKYRTWRALFSFQNDSRSLYVAEIQSGYSEADLQDPVDSYQDKSLHRRFVVQNFD